MSDEVYAKKIRTTKKLWPLSKFKIEIHCKKKRNDWDGKGDDCY